MMASFLLCRPIIYSSYNICLMALTSKLSNSSIAMLQLIYIQTIRNQHFRYQREKEQTLHCPFAQSYAQQQYCDVLMKTQITMTQSLWYLRYFFLSGRSGWHDKKTLNYNSRHISITPEALYKW